MVEYRSTKTALPARIIEPRNAETTHCPFALIHGTFEPRSQFSRRRERGTRFLRDIIAENALAFRRHVAQPMQYDE